MLPPACTIPYLSPEELGEFLQSRNGHALPSRRDTRMQEMWSAMTSILEVILGRSPFEEASACLAADSHPSTSLNNTPGGFNIEKLRVQVAQELLTSHIEWVRIPPCLNLCSRIENIIDADADNMGKERCFCISPSRWLSDLCLMLTCTYEAKLSWVCCSSGLGGKSSEFFLGISDTSPEI